jgi:hypothetical protein
MIAGTSLDGPERRFAAMKRYVGSRRLSGLSADVAETSARDPKRSLAGPSAGIRCNGEGMAPALPLPGSQQPLDSTRALSVRREHHDPQ